MNEITVRDGKGGKDRLTMLPTRLKAPLSRHLDAVRAVHHRDLADGYGQVHLPDALALKFPAAATEWAWQYLFPAPARTQDPRTDVEHRHHFGERSLQKAVQTAARAARLTKPVGCHTFRHNAEPGITGTPSRPTCWRTATTSAPCRSSSGTPTSRPR